jgi:hypothetical protein
LKSSSLGDHDREFTCCRYSLLSSLCEALAWLRLQHHEQQHTSADTQQGPSNVASAEELALMRQLDACPPIPSSCSPSTSEGGDMQPHSAAANKYVTVLQHEHEQQQLQDSRSQLEDQTQLATSSGTPAAHSLGAQALSGDRSASSSSCGFGTSKDRSRSSMATSCQQQQQQQQVLAAAPSCPQLQRQEQAAASAKGLGASIAPAGDPLWLLRQLMSQSFEDEAGSEGSPGGSAGAVQLKHVQAAAANR